LHSDSESYSWGLGALLGFPYSLGNYGRILAIDPTIKLQGIMLQEVLIFMMSPKTCYKFNINEKYELKRIFN